MNDFDGRSDEDLLREQLNVEEQARIASTRASAIAAELRRRFQATLRPGMWAKQRYGTEHVVTTTESGRCVCGRLFNPTLPGTVGTRWARCGRCEASIAKVVRS